jgi:toxin ParE1/3/4
MSRLIVSPLADQEIQNAHDWYEGQRRGLGKQFRAAVRAAFKAIRSNPARKPVYKANARRMRLKTFPYWVYWRIEADHSIVVTVFHESRDPADLLKNLGIDPP